MTTTLIKTVDGHRRAYPLVQPRITTHCGSGTLVYATDDGYLGVRLDGETRIDEYSPRVCSVHQVMR